MPVAGGGAVDDGGDWPAPETATDGLSAPIVACIRPAPGRWRVGARARDTMATILAYIIFRNSRTYIYIYTLYYTYARNAGRRGCVRVCAVGCQRSAAREKGSRFGGVDF